MEQQTSCPSIDIVATTASQVLEHAVNLKRSRPGDIVRIPYEVTVGYG